MIGQTVRQKLFGKEVAPLRESIRVAGLRLQVAGILKERGRGLTDADEDDLILMPLTTLQQKLVGEARLNMILAKARSVDEVDKAVRTITRVLRARHRVNEGAEDFGIDTVLDLYNLYQRLKPMKGLKKDK